MKMSDDLFTELKFVVSSMDTAAAREMYERGNFPRAEKTKDVSMRYRWDLLWCAVDAAKTLYGENHFQNKFNEEDLNDDHIDTALRAIVPDIVSKSATHHFGVNHE